MNVTFATEHPRGLTRVVEHPSGRAWLLQTPRSSYAVIARADGAVVQRHWGARLDDDALDGLIDGHRDRLNSSFERPWTFDEPLPFDGGMRWGLPALQARFANGVRTLDLVWDSAETAPDGVVLALRLVDRERRIRVELHYRLHTDDDVIDRWVVVSNDDPDAEVALSRFDSGSWLIPDLSAYRSTTAQGYWGGETQVQRAVLPWGEHRVGSRQGVTGHVANPWMMIDDGDATEEEGEVWGVALVWSGSWHITAQNRPEGMLTITAGWSQEGVDFRIPPGSSITSPVSSGAWTARGFGAMSRMWQDVVRRRILPHSDELRPVLYNSWEATEFDIDLATELELAEHAAALGIELFVVDDGWFHKRYDDTAGLGDWWPDEKRFPEGLSPLSQRVHELGMRFGVWVEPEMVTERSELYGAHPEWAMGWPGRTPTEIRNQRVLDFGRSEVQEYTIGWLDALISGSGIDFLKWDMNRPFTEAGAPDDLPRSDDIWRTHTEGVYAVKDEIRRRHPGLRIEGCSSGGARVDLGILHRVEQVWTSDNSDALDRQAIQHGFSQLYPAIAMSAWVTDHTNIVSRRRVPLEYRFHVAMAGALGIGADLRTWTQEELTTAARLIAVYKEIRPIVQFGEQFRLGGAPGREQSAVQYVHGPDAVVFSYDPHRSLSAAPRRIRLRGLDPGASYRDADSGEVRTGAFLMGYGIKAHRDENDRGWDNLWFSNRDYVSSLTVLRRV